MTLLAEFDLSGLAQVIVALTGAFVTVAGWITSRAAARRGAEQAERETDAG